MTRLASAITLATGAFWGLYWAPVRALGDIGLGGAWGTLAVTLAALVTLAPFAWRGLATADKRALAFIALGGAAFALYSVGFNYGRVAVIILLWFLSPVWSVLIGRFAMGWPTPPLRYAAIVVGLAGLTAMLGADGRAPLPQGFGEWASLVGGALWSVSTTGIRARPAAAPMAAAFVFALGASFAGGGLAPFLAPWPSVSAAGVGLAFATGALWWGASTVGLMWAAARLEPARVAILLMSEVLVGAATAAWFAQERLSAREWGGGALVLCAGLIEIWPSRGGGGGAADPSQLSAR